MLIDVRLCISNTLKNLTYRQGLLLSFVFGFIIRLIPEVLSYPHPIGFDTVGYAAMIKSGVIWSSWTSIFSIWLFEGILISVNKIVQMNPFLLLKLTAPLLYALNVCGIYYFSRKALNWSVKTALIAAFFFAFQLASLRLSWDLYRNVFGLGILLFALPFIRDIKTKKGFALFVLLSTFVVFSHQLVSVVMFAAVFGMMMSAFMKGEKVPMLKVLVATSPALVIFLISVYLILFPLPFNLETNVIDASQPSTSPGGLFFLANYLSVPSSVQYPTYLDLVSHVFSLFGVLFLLCMPLVFVGFFRDGILDGWTLWLLVGSFSPLITPFCGLIAWDRWMCMLVYPFTFYAVNGIWKVLGSQSNGARPNLRWIHGIKVSKKTVFGILLSMVLLGFLFMVVRYRDYGVLSIPTTSLYLPSNMLYNTIPLQDVKGAIESMEWLNKHMNDGSSVLVHQAFLSWAQLYLDKKHPIILYYMKDVERALNTALKHGFDPIYMIFWNENIGWYGLSVPKDFVSISSSGRISVFKYSQQ